MQLTKSQKLAYLGLETSFISSIVILGWLRPISSIELWLLPFLVLATMRMAITISENEVMAWLRAPFTVTEPDSCGAGDSVCPAGTGITRVIGGLLACPICTGTWAALVLVALYAVSHNIGLVAILVLGSAGGSEYLYYAKEHNSWAGRMARVQCGAAEQEKLRVYEDLFVKSGD